MLIVAAAAVLALVLLAVLVARAPLGYQDESGFHYGLPPSPPSRDEGEIR